METLIIIGKIILFIGIWLAGVFLWGYIRQSIFGYKSYTPRRKRDRRDY